MRRTYPYIPFERYCDDVIVHLRTEEEATLMRTAIEKRLAQCKLELNSQKTEIVYCKDDRRGRTYPNEKFDFFGVHVSVPEVEDPVG